jgi:hypothetical protein
MAVDVPAAAPARAARGRLGRRCGRALVPSRSTLAAGASKDARLLESGWLPAAAGGYLPRVPLRRLFFLRMRLRLSAAFFSFDRLLMVFLERGTGHLGTQGPAL